MHNGKGGDKSSSTPMKNAGGGGVLTMRKG